VVTLKRFGPVQALASFSAILGAGFPLHKPLFRGHNEKIIWEDFESAYEGFTSHSKPWTHEAILFGASEAQSEEFFKKFRSCMLHGPETKHDSYQEAFTILLGELAEELFPEREFHSPAFRTHELYPKNRNAEIPEKIREAVVFALKYGAPLIFKYESVRFARNGRQEKQVHVHRMNVRSVSDTWFRAEHTHGIKSFSFSKVISAGVEGTSPQVVGEEPVVSIVITTNSMANSFKLRRRGKGSSFIKFAPEKGKQFS